MASKNGGKYLAQQLESILPQLHSTDELIVTDDCSVDDTVKIVESFKDARVTLRQNNRPAGITATFEASLMLSKGDHIFLADQDDVWLPKKAEIMIRHLQDSDLVISDCLLVDHKLVPGDRSFHSINNSGKGLLRNLVRNSYMGCCMAFNRSLMKRAMPFPKDIPLHDFWIGLIGEMYFRVKFIPDVLIYHRRHATNASTNGELSKTSLSPRMVNRYRLIKNLFLHRLYAE